MYLITYVINNLKKIKGFLTKTLDPLGHISKESKDIEQTLFVQRPAVWPWPCDLKINRGHLLPRGIHNTKFGNFHAKGSKDWANITWSTDRPTDRQVQNNTLPFNFKGGRGGRRHNYLIEIQFWRFNLNIQHNLHQHSDIFFSITLFGFRNTTAKTFNSLLLPPLNGWDIADTA